MIGLLKRFRNEFPSPETEPEETVTVGYVIVSRCGLRLNLPPRLVRVLGIGGMWSFVKNADEATTFTTSRDAEDFFRRHRYSICSDRGWNVRVEPVSEPTTQAKEA